MVARLRRLLGAELSGLSDDPEVASYQLVAVSPLGPADHQVLLETGSTSERLARLDELLGELETDLERELRLRGGPEDSGEPGT